MGARARVFAGGPILTMADGLDAVEAIAVRGGWIVHAGRLSDCRHAAGGGHEEVDLMGRCLMPGFIDAHAHLLAFGQFSTMADLRYPRVRSIDDLVRALSDHARGLPPGAPVRGFGYDHHKLAERRHPTAADLDRVAADRPVYIIHTTCHFGVANTYLLRQKGIGPATPDPPGGRIERDERGQPTGLLCDAATRLVTGEGVETGNHGPNFHIPDPLEQLVEMVELGCRRYLAAGITTVVDAQVTRREMEAYLAARAAGRLHVRVVMMYLSSYLDDLIHLGLRAPLGDAMLTLGAVKFYSDGSLIGGTARFTCPYCTRPDFLGLYYHEPEELRQLVVRAHEFGLQTATHAQGDAGIESVLRALEAAQKAARRGDVRHRIEHCGVPRRDQLTRIRDLGAWPVAQPAYIHEAGDGILRNIGRERAEGLIPLASFKRLGIPVVLSSDSPVVDYRPLLGIMAAVTRRSADGTVLGGEEAVSVRDALRGYTVAAAASIHRERELGSLEPGKRADFVILDRSPLEVAPEELARIRVLETWVGGERRYGA